MLEIAKTIDSRLVVALGDRASRWTRIILDRGAERAWFEHNHPRLPQFTRSVRLADIASIATQTITEGATATDVLVVRTSKGRHRVVCAPGTAQEAASQLRAFLGLTEAPPHVTRTASPLAQLSRRAVAAGAVVVVVVTVVALVASLGHALVGVAGKAGHAASAVAGRVGDGLAALPACDAAASVDTIQELVRDRLGPTARLTDITEEGLRGGERLCRALARRDGTVAKVAYRNYRDGWTAKSRLSSEIVTAKLDAARSAAIAAAAAKLLAAGHNAHLTGRPPRQTDPAIDAALATVFGVSDLAAEPLAADEIEKALQWLATADRIGALYILAGTGFDDFAKVPQTEAIQRRLRSNVVAFAAEFGRYADFQLIMLSAIGNAQMRLAARTPQHSADDVRTRLSQAMASQFIALVYDGHNDGWRMARLTALGRAAPVAAKFLTAKDARVLRDHALQTVDYLKDEQVRARIREIAAMLPAA